MKKMIDNTATAMHFLAPFLSPDDARGRTSCTALSALGGSCYFKLLLQQVRLCKSSNLESVCRTSQPGLDNTEIDSIYCVGVKINSICLQYIKSLANGGSLMSWRAK